MLLSNKCLLGEMKYIYKTKTLKAHYTNINDNDKKDKNTALSLNLVWTIVGDGMLAHIFKNVNLSNNSGVSTRDVKPFSSQLQHSKIYHD